MHTNAIESIILQYNLLNNFKNELNSYKNRSFDIKKVVYRFKIKILYIL